MFVSSACHWWYEANGDHQVCLTQNPFHKYLPQSESSSSLMLHRPPDVVQYALLSSINMNKSWHSLDMSFKKEIMELISVDWNKFGGETDFHYVLDIIDFYLQSKAKKARQRTTFRLASEVHVFSFATELWHVVCRIWHFWHDAFSNIL